MIELELVYSFLGSTQVLYDLLKERTPYQSISHKAMPTFTDHAEFVLSKPYLAWYLIKSNDSLLRYNYNADYVGSVYLTRQREIGIFIFNRHKGKSFASAAINLLMEAHPGKFLANINPSNEVSIKFFEKFGAKHIQNTYEL